MASHGGASDIHSVIVVIENSTFDSTKGRPVSLRAWAAQAPAWRLPPRGGESSRLPQAEDDIHARAICSYFKRCYWPPRGKHRSLLALLLAASRQKPQAERVLHEFLPLLGEDAHQDDPYLLLAVANAYNVLKQPTRAKNILKRTISSIPWTPENADGLERCWLEVADSQVSAGRADAARELLTKILNHNRSCAPAYQLLGFLAEKEQNYKSAAQNFDNAWRYTGKTNLAVGYKLAHAYLKLKKYPECIVVSTHILKTHPDYPKIRKEILEKAKTNLRT
ncbi:unnamed protein product [Plutella xylostella]|uniref:(diamondback moth) hypothetical protein n=1 Tax=Plutella xylostella TaxID=51655 RepID=A0A8S4FUW1_PLUXY|nr:unnamed protein product [Plutella xylostella]